MPLISVVIPVYNGEKTIEATLRSLIDQTFSDFEVLIIDDGSTDSTLEVIKTFEDKRLQVFSYPNGGPAASRNRGLRLAQGKYISFLDADDLWTPDKLESQLLMLQSNPEAVLAYSWTDYIDESDNFLFPGCHTTATGNVLEKLFIHNFIENGSNVLIDRDKMCSIGEFDESLPPAEDWEFFLRLAAHYPFVAVPSPQVLYRKSPGSLSTNLARVEKCNLKVINQMVVQFPESLQSLKSKSVANLYRYLTFLALTDCSTRKRAWTAFQYWRKSLIHNPERLRSSPKLSSIVTLKILAILVLGKNWKQVIGN